MCVKNLNSYGCGHKYRETSSCGHNCVPEIGYNFIGEYDCSACEAAGQQVGRGSDGLGPHGQAMSRRQKKKEETQSVTGPVIDVSGEVSPWAQCPTEGAGERRLHGGRRRRDADEAWEHEHRSRMDDLSLRAESMSFRSDATTTRPRTAANQARRRSPSPMDLYSSTDDEKRVSSRSRSDGPRFGQVMSVADMTAMRTPSRRQQQLQRYNYDSQDSLVSSAPPKGTTTAAASVSGPRPQKPGYSLDSGYGSHGCRSHRWHGSRAGSYASPPSGKAAAAAAAAAYAYHPASYRGVELPRYSTY